MKIATWNVNSLKVRLAHLLDWLSSAQPDVLCLQELKLEDEKFPHAEIKAAGYHAVVSGQKTYNGVAILSRDAISDVRLGLDDYVDDQRRVITATVQGIRVMCVYCPNGQALDSDKFVYKLGWFSALQQTLAKELATHTQLAVAGDFNIAPEDRDVHDPKAWEGQVLVSTQERTAWQQLLSLGLVDTFRLFPQEEKMFSWWDYRMMGFRRNAGLRIDHVLASTALATRCREVHIDRAPRKLDRPSDHTPVIATFTE